MSIVNIERKRAHEKKPKISIENSVSLESLKKSLEEEIFTSINNFKDQDENTIEEIEKNVNLDNQTLTEKIKKEINLKESLQKINNDADNLKQETLHELTLEKSFWKGTESLEEKIEKVEYLFNSLDTEKLQREDTETHAQGWNVTNNIIEINSFKESIIACLSGKNYWGLRASYNFEELISQKGFQDIVWLAAGLDPSILTSYQSNLKFNTFIQERPEFLESQEFKGLRLHQIKEGIRQKTLFEGYVHNKKEEFPKEKLNFFKRDSIVELDMDKFDSKNKKNIWEEDKNKKTKRKSLGHAESKFIIDIEKYEYDISNIDELTDQEKNEVKEVFIDTISRNIYGRYSSDSIFADEIFKIASKLGISEDEVNRYAYDAMYKGIISGNPPANGIDQEFSKVYEKLQKNLEDKESRTEIINSLKNNISGNDKRLREWEGSLKYINISPEEKKAIITAYLDFSQEKPFQEKQRDIFGYSWTDEESFLFSKEDRLQAFSTMRPEQRACIIEDYSGGNIEKISFLPFTKNDVLEFAVSELDRSGYVYPHHIEKAQEKIKKNFPNIFISDEDIAKRATFKNLDSIQDINIALERCSVKMSPSEIVSQFSSPEDFVLKQIEGADLNKLITLKEFRNNPGAPELPYLPKELFNEIKGSILKYKNGSYDQTPRLKELISFVPNKYNLDLLTDPSLQEVFSNLYANALRKKDHKFIGDLGFYISKSESLYNAEQKVLDEYIQKKDYHTLIEFHKILFDCDRSSPIIKKIEELFKEKLASYDSSEENKNLNSYTLEKTLKDTSEKKLNELTPENLGDEDEMSEWINIKYGTDSKNILQAFNLVKDRKDFSYFDKEIKDYAVYGPLSEKFIGTLQECSKNKDNSLDRAIEFIKDMRNIFDNNIVKQNYDYLYQKLSNLSPEEYAKEIDLLKQVRPYISSPLISKIKFDKLFDEVSSYSEQEQKKFFNLIDTTSYKLEAENDLGWAKNIIVYVNEVEEIGVLHRDQDKKDKMVDLFSGDYKNTALREMTSDFKNFLDSSTNFLPPQIRLVSNIINEAGGAGNMKHIESLGNLIFQIQTTLENKKTTNETVVEIKKMLSDLEERFSKEKFLQDDISEFYNLSKDMLEAAPSLYTKFGPIFENISSAKDMKKFMSDIFPFYQTQLVIKQDISDDDTTYNPRDLVEMRKSINEFAKQLKQGKGENAEIFELEKLRLLEVAKNGFKDRFGLLNVPDNFTKENLRSIQNTIRYMGNINGRTPQRESLISLYLGLELDNKWSDFRGGKDINFGEYISEKQLQLINSQLEEKQKGYKLLSEISGIKPEDMSKFQDILQADVSNNLIGNVQTIDIKLGNIKRNIDELADPDIYRTKKEKDILKIFSEEGKNVNAILAKLYGISAGKNIQLSEEDNNTKQKLESIFSVSEWTQNKVKEIQEEIQPMGLVSSMINKMQEEKVEENIIDLQANLTPNGQIIEIFNKLGEEFHQESGALALSKDLSYLENLIVKNENKISIEEKEAVANYIESIRGKMKNMENVFDHVKQYFEKIKKSSHLENNPILKSRLTDIEKIIYSQDTSSVITSQMTKELNLIIENMRQCLGCMRKEANNDTNLAFGDYNKFFIMNQSEKEKGSISDEIVFFVPITLPDGSKEMSFVMDGVYGSKSSDILIGNISAVHKKYNAIKKEFPEAKISISVTRAAMNSVGLSGDILEKRLKEVLGSKVETAIFEELNAFVPKSSLSDNYIEFGASSSARASGERNFSGIIIK